MTFNSDSGVRSPETVTDSTPEAASGSAAVVRHWEPDESLLVPLLETIAELTDQRTDELEPLHSVIDPDALKMVLSPSHRVGDIHVSFSYEGCQITVSNTGELVVDPDGGTDG